MAIVNGYCTLPQLKDHMGVADDADGSLMEAAITAASREIDRYTGRRFYSDSVVSARVYRATSTHRLVVDDFSTTSGLIVATDEGDTGSYTQTWTVTTDYVAFPFNGVLDGLEGLPFYELHAVGNRWFHCSMRPRVQVTAKWGWASVPDAVTEACLIEAARLFRRKDTPDGIAGGFEFGPVRVSSRFDPDVAMLLSPFVKPVVAV